MMLMPVNRNERMVRFNQAIEVMLSLNFNNPATAPDYIQKQAHQVGCDILNEFFFIFS